MRIAAIFLSILAVGSGLAADEPEHEETTWRERVLDRIESLPPAEANWKVERYLYPQPRRLEEAKQWNQVAAITGDEKMRGLYEHAAGTARKRAMGLAVPIFTRAIVGGPWQFRIEKAYYPSQQRSDFKDSDWTEATSAVLRYHGNSDQLLVVHDVISRRVRYADADQRLLGSQLGMPIYRVYHLLRAADGVKLDSEDAERATLIGIGNEPTRPRAEGFIKFELVVEKPSLAPVELRVFRFSDTRPATELKVIPSEDDPFFPAEVMETRFDSTFRITRRERWVLQDGFPKPVINLDQRIAFAADASLRIEDDRSDKTSPPPFPVTKSSRLRSFRPIPVR